MSNKLPEYRYDAKAYEREEQWRPDEMMMLSRAGQLACEWLDQQKNARCLDLCCGTGLSMEAIVDHRNVAEVVGVDICSQYIKHAKGKKLFQCSRTQPRFIEGDAVSVHVPPGPWDLIMLCSAYHHIEHDRKLQFLRRVSRLLGSKGRAIMAENILPAYTESRFNRDTYCHAVRQFYDAVVKTARSHHPDLPDDVEKLIARVAQHGYDGDYEFKVHFGILLNHLDDAGLVETADRERVWPDHTAQLPREAGNFVLTLRAK